MKKQIQVLVFFAVISITGWAQSISFTSFATTTNIGTNLTVNYKYTIASDGQVACNINLLNDWTVVSYIAGGFSSPAIAGTDVTGTFNILIPNGTVPTANLTGLQNYKINIELKTAAGGWLAGDYPSTQLNFTAPAVTPAISITSIPTSTQVGTNLVVNYKYTAAASTGKTTILVSKNGGTNPWDFISTIGYIELDPAAAGTDVAGTFTVPIPANTTPTAALTGNENYRVTLELKNSSNGFLAGDFSTIGYNLTAAPIIPAISITSIPTSTEVGTNLVVNYKYTAAASTGKTTILVSKNGGTNPWDFISTVAYLELDPAAAGTDVAGTFTVPIPANTTPTSALTGNENYRVTLELKNSSNGFLAGDFSTINYNFILTTTTWIGASNTTWNNPANWNNGIPDATKDVVIGSGTNQPIISSNQEVKSLQINTSSSLIVNTGANLTVVGAVVNNGGSLIIDNDANLIQGGTTNTNSGNITVKRNSNALSRLDYTLWSSPVANQNLLNFSPATTLARFNNYNEATNQFDAITSPSTTSFLDASGYLIRMPNDAVTAPATQTFVGLFSGVPNNGTIVKAVNYSGTMNGYNLIGNPYPSSIDANAFISANSANIEGSLYFWRKTNAATGSGYAVYNSMGGTMAAAGGEVPNGTIQVGQGFFVKAKSTSNVTFTNTMRVTPNSTQFFRLSTIQKDRLWINLTNNSGAFSQILVGFTALASQGVDVFDAKYINNSPIALTSIINNEEYTIQGRSTFNPNNEVLLNFKTDVAGSYTLALNQFDGVFLVGQDIFLVDAITGIQTNLKITSYNFATTAGIFANRFKLKFQSTLNTINPNFNENNVFVFNNDGTLYIQSKSILIQKIQVYDLLGKLVAQQNNINNKSTSIKNLNAVNQLLLLKITASDGTEVTKKIIH